MDADALTPADLFDGKVTYEIPPFQRPYVWTEEDQWQPLWDDIERLADARFEPIAGQPLPTHFLGAVVLKELGAPAGDPSRHSVIDGQQRLTTLQLVLDATETVVADHGYEDDSESLQELVINGAKRFAGTSKRFKLWPSRVDRDIFRRVMDDEVPLTTTENDFRIAQAHLFFADAIREWAQVTGDPDKSANRLTALVEVLQQQLKIVRIQLDVEDDDQLIFETLNDRGTPLLAADLIKNFVFQRCEAIGADVDRWGEKYWLEFDGDWWREEIAQGRQFRSRIDLFLQYWLTMRTRSEVQTDSVFARFRKFSDERLSTVESAEEFLRELRADADTYRDLTALDKDTPAGSFYWRVVEELELGAFIPLLLWMISQNHNPLPDQVNRALAAFESWAVRRTMLRMTMKGVNKFVVSVLQQLDEFALAEFGDRIVGYLRDQEADARIWPSDDRMREEIPSIKVYGNIKQSRLRAILAAVELHLRDDPRSEAVDLPAKLEIEHVMPKGWRTYWGGGIAHEVEASARRDVLVNTIGNLTLATQRLNVALSNRPWTDSEAEIVAPTGRDAGVGKRSLLNRYSLLILNKRIVEAHPYEWTETDIERRSAAIAEMLVAIWPR